MEKKIQVSGVETRIKYSNSLKHEKCIVSNKNNNNI